jgi:death-on-curing protein
MKYLTREQILLIHSILIDETGGSHGVRDYHAIFSLEDLPRQSVFGKELYPTIFEKAAVLARNIIVNHPFIDGNKRTGITTASVFLESNGYILGVKDGKIKAFALRIVLERLSVKDISKWFQKNSKQVKKNDA